MRYLIFLTSITLLLAGCGTPVLGGTLAAPKPTSTPKPVHVTEPGARFHHAPPMTINVHRRYEATFVTNLGRFTVRLFPQIAPLAVNNFVFLARHGYYNRNQFFRIIANFMIQTGDPTNTGFGGPGYTFRDEKVTMKYNPGIVAMANRGPNSNGSQFFIVTGPQAKSLPPNYTIFGKVSKGMSVVEKIADTPVTESPTNELSQPLSTREIRRIVIHEGR